jgi:hypothetical protein
MLRYPPTARDWPLSALTTARGCSLSWNCHWLSRGETRLQMLKSSMAFIEANNPPD